MRAFCTAVQAIVADSQAGTINLPHLDAQTIHQVCQPAGRGVKSRGIDPAEKSPANSVLAERTPLEQEILRPYYVLDESPDEIGFACKCVRSMSHKQSPAREPNIGGKRRESNGLGTILYCTGSGPSVPRQHCAGLAFTIVKNTGGIREKGRLAFIGFTPFGACQQASETGFGPIRVRNIIRYEYCHKKEDRRIAILMLRTGRYDTVVTVGMQRYNKLMRFQPANARPSLFGSD